MDFDELKRIKIVEVLGRYGVSLRYRGIWASAPCPLPTHKRGDRNRTFTVNVVENYWRCFSESCNANNGGKKGGDILNLVAILDGCRIKVAGEKLADWYGLNGQKTAEHMARRVVREEVGCETPPPKDNQYDTSRSDSGKGYIKCVDNWFDELFELTEEMKANEYWKRCRNGTKAKLIESYKNGKAAR